ncbi:uncharacterized protein LOC106027219 isoform X3 [Cavia porcellus]|uniref:uncharacterized protein LOC106027219 isoform X3 n=1 Tax=Cavia porcellus TaxID=10141 RepID=UPI002FE09EFD
MCLPTPQGLLGVWRLRHDGGDSRSKGFQECVQCMRGWEEARFSLDHASSPAAQLGPSLTDGETELPQPGPEGQGSSNHPHLSDGGSSFDSVMIVSLACNSVVGTRRCSGKNCDNGLLVALSCGTFGRPRPTSCGPLLPPAPAGQLCASGPGYPASPGPPGHLPAAVPPPRHRLLFLFCFMTSLSPSWPRFSRTSLFLFSVFTAP